MPKPERKHQTRLSVLDRRAPYRVRPHEALDLVDEESWEVADEDLGSQEITEQSGNLSLVTESVPDVEREYELMLESLQRAEQLTNFSVQSDTQEEIALFHLYSYVDDADVFMHGETGEIMPGKEKRADNRRSKWLATATRLAHRRIATFRVEGLSVKNRARRRRGLPPIGQDGAVMSAVVADFQRAREYEKKKPRHERGTLQPDGVSESE